MSEPLDRPQSHEEEGGHPFWPTHVLDEAIIFFALFGVLITLAVFFPFGLHGEADPLHTPEAIKPEWYFLATYQFLKYVPKVVGVLGVGVFFVAMFFWPFIDELLYRRMGHRRLAPVVGWAVMLVFLTLTLLGRLSETTIHLGPTAVHFDFHGVPHLGGAPEEGRGQ